MRVREQIENYSLPREEEDDIKLCCKILRDLSLFGLAGRPQYLNIFCSHLEPGITSSWIT